MTGNVGGIIIGAHRVPGQSSGTDGPTGLMGQRSVQQVTAPDGRGLDMALHAPSGPEGGIQARRLAVGGATTPPPQRPDGPLNSRIGERLATFDTLLEKMGGRPPHKDVRIGPLVLWRHSIAYKEVRAGLQEYQALAARTLPAGPERAEAIADLGQAMDKVAEGARNYIAYHAGNPSRTAEIAAMQEVLEQVAVERGLLEDAAADPALDSVAGDLSFGAALQVKRAGIAYADCAFKDFQDADLDHARCDHAFGAGKANSVTLLVYGDGKEYVFKAEPFTDTDSALVLPDVLGIDRAHPHYGNRNIAALAVDRAIGSHALCAARIVEHEGRLGLLMDRAEGLSPFHQYSRPSTDDEIATAERARDYVSPEDYEALLTEMNMALAEDGTIFSRPVEARNVLALAADRVGPHTRPELVRQLTGLEWSDSLTGQADRHGMNYMVSIEADGMPLVTGIDNDMCFGTRSTSVPDQDTSSVHNPGLPNLVDREQFELLRTLDFDRDLAPRLSGLLSSGEMDATRARLTEIQAHLATLDPAYVVDDWSAWRAPEGQDAMTFLADHARPSLWQRDFAEFEA